MAPDELETTTDVDAVWRALLAAKADGDDERVRQLESRMRELAGHNDDRVHPHRDYEPPHPHTVIVSPNEGAGGGGL